MNRSLKSELGCADRSHDQSLGQARAVHSSCAGATFRDLEWQHLNKLDLRLTSS